jgi:hypothetical protein
MKLGHIQLGVISKPQVMKLNVTNFQSVFEDLKSKEVTFVQEPDIQPWGTFAIIEDSEGNHILLVKQPQGSLILVEGNLDFRSL